MEPAKGGLTNKINGGQLMSAQRSDVIRNRVKKRPSILPGPEDALGPEVSPFGREFLPGISATGIAASGGELARKLLGVAIYYRYLT